MNRKNYYADIDKWRKTCHDQRLRYYRKTQDAENSNQPWTLEEIEMVLEHSMHDNDLSKKIGRSVQAIQSKRSKLKKKGVKNEK